LLIFAYKAYKKGDGLLFRFLEKTAAPFLYAFLKIKYNILNRQPKIN